MQPLEDGLVSNAASLPVAAWAELGEALLAAAPAARPRLLRARPLANPAPLFHHLCARSLEVAREEPTAALSVAAAAVSVARAARAPGLTAPARADLRAQAWAYVANAWRVRERFAEAERAWRRAHRLRALGSGDPVFAAGLAEMQAQLRRGQRKLAEATALLEAAISAYREAGGTTPLGRALFSASNVAYLAGNAGQAYRLVLQALRACRQGGHHELFYWAVRASVLYLAELGHSKLALRMFVEVEAAAPLFEGEVTRLKTKGIAGRVFRACGAWEEAQKCFEEVCRGFAAKGLHYDAALVAFDLAWAYAEKGRWLKVSDLALAMNDTFCAMDIPREAAAAFDLFLRAASNYRVTWSVMQEVQGQLAPLRRERGF